MSPQARRLERGCAEWPDELDILAGLTPPTLWWLGDAWPARAVAVAVVGSRQATAAGLAVAHDIGRELASRGIVVVSGFARGIDAAAHSGAVAAGGITVAVCGCGVDVDYPRGHSRLRQAVLSHGGALLAEFAPATEPRPGHFPQRNRLIAALSRAVIVVEATERSGALSTARWAADLGRDILAVPGPLHNLGSRGTNRLIRDGARPFLEIEDALDALGVAAAAPAMPFAEPSGDSIVGLVSGGPTHPDTLASHLGVGPRELAVRLAELELAGRIRSLPGGLIEAVASHGGGRGSAQHCGV